MAKLKKILEDVFQDKPKINKYEVIEGVKNFQNIGRSMYDNGSILETAQQLSRIAAAAHAHVLGENDDWFDKVSVTRNMKQLKSHVTEFKKAAKESHMLNQRLTSLYEDIGGVLNRYYEISEDVVENVDDIDDEEAADEFSDLKDKDIDNDGEVDDEDSYLHHKLGHVAKRTESKKPGVGGVVGIPALGQFVPSKIKK